MASMKVRACRTASPLVAHTPAETVLPLLTVHRQLRGRFISVTENEMPRWVTASPPFSTAGQCTDIRTCSDGTWPPTHGGHAYQWLALTKLPFLPKAVPAL